MQYRKIFLVFVALVLLPAMAQAKLTVASGAGYRSVVNALSAAFEKETGNHIDLIYGNMAQVTFQAKNSGAVDMVIGERNYLTKEQLPFTTTSVLGKGQLVAIYPKGVSYTKEDDLFSDAVKRIAIPDTKRAIYGKAGLEYLKNTGRYDAAKDKLMMVSAIPQAASYVISGEVDFAFVNITHALKIKDDIGGYLALDQTKYAPIEIIVGEMKDTENDDCCQSFLKFIQTDAARQIVAKAGM